jgi:hypothetical protein
MPLAALLVSFLAQSQGIDEALRTWAQDDPALHDAASREVVRRWKEWTPEDLSKLARAAMVSDGEIAARANAAQAEVHRRLKFGEKVWPKVEKAEALIAGLRSGGERVRLMGWSIPGGPMFDFPPTVKELIALGADIEPYLCLQLADPLVRREVSVVLAQTGGLESLPALIDAIPPVDGLEYTCAVYALFCLTQKSIGFDSRGEVGWSPEVPAQWRRWYEERKDFLFGTGGNVSLDVEAWVLGKSTKTYRKDHPWILYDEIKEPKDGAEYEARLREYCISLLLRNLWHGGEFDGVALGVLSEAEDPRSLATVRRLAREPADPQSGHVWGALALSRKAPETLPDLERLLTTTKADQARRVQIPLAWAKLHQKLGTGLLSRAVEGDEAVLLMKCLEEKQGIPVLLEKLRGTEPEEGLIEIAGFLKDDRVATSWREMQGARPLPPLLRLRSATALGRSGDLPSLDVLRAGLRDEEPHVRLAAAEGLWTLSNREGFKTLLSLLGTRPLEDGRTASPGARCLVHPERSSSLHVVRRSCELLGEMGDPAAIEPMKKILKENLNGFLGMPASSKGTGWYGRPDVVALAKLGDLSGMELLLASLRNGDPLGAAGDAGIPGDFVQIGLKFYARALVPLLAAAGHERKNLYAARAILTLLDHGR